MYTFFLSIFFVIVILLVLLLLPACCMICKWRQNERDSSARSLPDSQTQTSSPLSVPPYVINIEPESDCREPPPYEKTVHEDQPPAYDEIFGNEI